MLDSRIWHLIKLHGMQQVGAKPAPQGRITGHRNHAFNA